MLHITMFEMIQSIWWNFFPSKKREAIVEEMERHWSGAGGGTDAMVSLSVRTTFDLFLQALNLPEGSEVIFTAITIKDMVAIAKHHKLVPVPLDLDTATMVPLEHLLESAFSPKTRVLVLAHIFGARMDIEPWLRYARQRGVLVIDDCAEVFEGHDAYSGHPEADMSVFSFGSIKTCSALGGSMARVRDAATLKTMRELHAKYPIRGRLFFLKRVLNYAFLRWMQAPLICGIMARVLELLGSDLDTFITNNVRGFAGMDLIFGIRHQAPTGMLALLKHKIQTFDRRYINQRVRLARALEEQLRPSNVEIPGANCERNSFWLFPIIVANPGVLIAILRRHGFDVTQGASQLNYVPITDDLTETKERAIALYPHNASRLWLNLLYLPVYPEMPLSEVLRMGALVKRHAVRVSGDPGLCQDRQAVWEQLQQRKFDVLVVGGGINGSAVARDAASRGLSVALVERDDFASGASGNSAKLIHGGFRYVERFMLTLVNELCRERDLQHRLNPNLVGRIPFLLPQYASYKNRMNKIDLGLWIYDACSFFQSPLHSRHTPARAVAHEAALRQEGMLGSFKYYDCWTNDARLTLSNVREAASNGTTVLNHCEFVAPVFASVPMVGNQVVGATVKDSFSGAQTQISARHIVYATGAEVDNLPWQNNNNERVIDATKGSHIVVSRLRLPLSHCVGYRSPSDARWCFCVPFQNVIVIGTTDSSFDVAKGGAKVHASRSDVDYLLEATNYIFPGARLTDDDVQCTWAGLRPLVRDENNDSQGGQGSSLLGKWRNLWNSVLGGSSAGSTRSREEKYFRDERGITVIAGGKLTPYRLVSERAVDMVVRALGVDGMLEPCLTHLVPLDLRLSAVEAGTAMWWTFGSWGLWLEKRAITHPAETTSFAPGGLQLSHVSLCVLLEQAFTLEDVMVRRLGLFYSLSLQGLECASIVAAHMAHLLGKDNAWVIDQVKLYSEYVAHSRAWKKEPSPAPRLVNLIN